MFKEVDERFYYLLDVLKRNKLNTSMVERAYHLADKLHSKQTRASGEPYISHPVEVAIILAELNMDTDAICAALLHDVVEDCGQSVEFLQEEFNKNIATMVDTVSAITQSKYSYDGDVFEDEDFLKFNMDEKTIKKLVTIGKRCPLGLSIKFADRLHNLRTIGAFPRAKQLEKVKETERWILPLTKVLKAEYFYREIKNECFKIKNQNDYGYLRQYKFYHNVNRENFERLITKFKETFSSSCFTNIVGNEIKEYKVFNQLKEIFKNITFDQISQGQIMKVSNYNLYLLYENKTIKDALNEFFNAYKNGLNKIVTIVNARLGRFNDKLYFVLEDNIKNIYYLSIMEKSYYIQQTIGTLDGQVELLDENFTHDIPTDYIRVKTRSGDIKYVQKDCTVLDFAFKLKKELGLGFKYAIINNSTTHFPPYTRLNENDLVEIVTHKNKYDETVPNAELKWLAYVNTDLAKSALIKHFEKLL